MISEDSSFSWKPCSRKDMHLFWASKRLPPGKISTISSPNFMLFAQVLSGQAMILTEIRSLHQFWKDQLGAGQSQFPQ